MATYGIQAFSASGELVFDSNTHRVMKYIKTVVSPQFTLVAGTSQRYVYNMPELTMNNSLVTVTVKSGYVGGMSIDNGKVYITGSQPNVDLHFYRF